VLAPLATIHAGEAEMMHATMKNRDSRWSSLPTAVLLLTCSVGFASVGLADETPHETTVVTAARLETPDMQELRGQIEAMAENAAWRTRISVASRLSARLNTQRRPYRLANRNSRSWRRAG
jgi:tripartite-type tricarboxylate transporter receptor subunit TctC